MKPTNSSDEERWIAGARRGDADAFESLMHLHEKQIYGLCLRLCGNSEDAREVAQETFLSAWQGLPAFRGDASFPTWLYRLASNACMDLLRRERRSRGAAGPSLDDTLVNFEIPDPMPGPQEHAEQDELHQAVLKGLETLSPEHREVLILREIHQLSYDEISEVLDLDEGTVKSRINRARKQLRAFLARSGNFFTLVPSKRTEKEGGK